jgi:acetolactate synthase-1/2/3 large subunit
VKMRVADYLTNKLYEAGGETVFLITGGMIMHLTDALRAHCRQRYVCCHHEQAAVMAAEAYGRMTGRLGVAYVTAGPGALNTLNGVVGAYVDSSPCIIVSGQSKVSQATVTNCRQFALQGFNTLPIFRQVTKYAVMLNDLARVKYEVEKCIHIAKSPRVGPVWIEIPIDMQGNTFDPDDYEGYVPEPEVSDENIWRQIEKVAACLKASRRPSLLAGAGVRLAGAVEDFNSFIHDFRIPTMTSRLGMDLMGYDNSFFVGRPGTYGDRPANFTVQNSDLFISVGSRLSIGMVGYDFEHFAENAQKVMVDVDSRELEKPAVRPDIPIRMDAKLFFKMLRQALGDFKFDNQAWINQTRFWKEKYPVDLPEYVNEAEGINSYHFISRLSEYASADEVFVCDTGSCFHVFAQAFRVKYGQRHIITGGLSTMGYCPASIGVAVAAEGKDVYCISGDGSVQFNIQEFQTIVHNRLPIKTVILNNNGYLLIRHTQNNFQDGRLIGTDAENGVSFADMKKIASAYGIKYISAARLDDLDFALDELFKYKGPVIFEVMTPQNQILIPRVTSKKLEDGSMVSMPYDDMFPFLPRDEYERNCFRANTL